MEFTTHLTHQCSPVFTLTAMDCLWKLKLKYRLQYVVTALFKTGAPYPKLQNTFKNNDFIEKTRVNSYEWLNLLWSLPPSLPSSFGSLGIITRFSSLPLGCLSCLCLLCGLGSFGFAWSRESIFSSFSSFTLWFLCCSNLWGASLVLFFGLFRRC